MRYYSRRSKVVGVSVDWITATATSTIAQEALWQVGNTILHGRKSEGEEPSGWHANGYRGFIATGVRLAARTDSVMLQLSGSQPAENWKQAVAAAENISRLDLTVDCSFNPVMPRVSRHAYVDAGHVPLRNGRRAKRSLIINSDGGSTCYIGSRVSENFGRVYDKGREAETAPAGSLWRWEVELKGKTAVTAARRLVAMEQPASGILHYVAGWYRQRCSVEIADIKTSLTSVLSPRALSTDDSRLLWLSSSIRPCIRKLVQRVGREKVLAALGLLPQSAVDSQIPSTLPEVAQWLLQSERSIN